MLLKALALLVPLLCALGPVSAADIDVPMAADALAATLKIARPGDTLRLGTFDYAGPIIIDKPVTLEGKPGARVVGNGLGSVITIAADDVTLTGLTVTGSGLHLDTLDSAIVISQGFKRARVVDNNLDNNLTGVDVQGGIDATVSRNRIVGHRDMRVNERGPGIYVWNAPGLVAEDNDIIAGRDGIFINNSHDAVYARNRMSELRFAFHSMYANNIKLIDNTSIGNELGFALMYSRQVEARGNLSVGDRTHGLFLNYVIDASIAHNEVRDGGEKCLFVYNVNHAVIAGNRLSGCGIGVHFTGGSEDVTMAGNAFIGNRTQVKYVGTRWLEWSGPVGDALPQRATMPTDAAAPTSLAQAPIGNYWSDNAAFDIDGDGIADSPYRPNDTIDQLTWSQPMSSLLLGSPAVQLIRWAQSRFPGLMPGGVVDSHPLVAPGTAGVGPEADRHGALTLSDTSTGRQPS
ncbi:nitrous oxide reductase family maturation protein NosD [Oryzibacter oryziterrae]|uniref:nitrous oxide reductase family maturation protein NosD n=1 Tax=Oryzibacter oryziterrae TaxID=2766474 RepID=UPI001F34079A|nr:nitrous oxide reductase family maturation protein NosD [Oryzibacter oryziterrae]